jgi:hypothetical protein
MERAGARNAYYCPSCRGLTLTITVDEGTTPMFLACRRAGLEPDVNECKGSAASLMYPPETFFRLIDATHSEVGQPPDQWVPTADWEWYRPHGVDLLKLSAEMREHVDRGGLVLRRRAA